MSSDIKTYRLCKPEVVQGGVHCENPNILWEAKEGVVVNCRDCECVEVQTLPGSEKHCIWVIVDCTDDCGVCGQKIFEYCFCDSDKDCPLCTLCDPDRKVCVPKVCPPTPDCPNPVCDPLTGVCKCCLDDDDCPCNLVCGTKGCECPPDAPYYNSVTGCCDQCTDEHPCPACKECVDGRCLDKFCPPSNLCDNPKCDPKDGKCKCCISSGDCKKLNECCNPTTGLCECCPGYIRDTTTGECIPKPPCTTDEDCAPCEICGSEGDCKPATCPANQVPVLINGKVECVKECDCATGTGCGDPTLACQPSCTDPTRCGCKPCEGSCDSGCKEPCFCNKVTNRCEFNPCKGSCNSGADCGPGCGCDPVTKQCVPCSAIPCNSCDQVLGCRCTNGVDCNKVNSCPPIPCSHYSECGVGCTCYKGTCVNCANFSCANQDCANQPGCGCNPQNKCEGIQEPCEDLVELEKDNTNCDLYGRLYKSNCCPCPELTIDVKGRSTAENQSSYTLEFIGEIRKGAYDGVNPDSKPKVDIALTNPTDPAGADVAENESPIGGRIGLNVVTTYIVYRINPNGVRERQGETSDTQSYSSAYSTGTTADVFFRNIQAKKILTEESIDSVTVRVVSKVVFEFTLVDSLVFPNDCKYLAGTRIARYTITNNTEYLNFGSAFGNAKAVTVSSGECRKVLVKWTKSDDSTINELPFRKLYIPGTQVGSQTLYEDVLRTIDDGLESCKYYLLDFDCNCFGDVTKYIVFCSPPDIQYDLSDCNRCLTLKPPFEPCDVNMNKEFYVSFGDKTITWVGRAMPTEKQCSTTPFTQIKYGLVCDVMNVCTKTKTVDVQQLEVTGNPVQAACTAGSTELDFEVTGGSTPYNWQLFNNTSGSLIQSGSSVQNTISVSVNLTADTTYRFFVMDANGCTGETTTQVSITLDGEATLTIPQPCPGVSTINGEVLWTPQQNPYKVEILKNGNILVDSSEGVQTNNYSFSDNTFSSGDTYKAVIEDVTGCLTTGELQVTAKADCGSCVINATIGSVCANNLPGATAKVSGTISGAQGTPTWTIKNTANSIVATGQGVAINADIPVQSIGEMFTIEAQSDLGLVCPSMKVTVSEKPSEQCNVPGCPSCPDSSTNPVAITISGVCGGGANQVGQVTLTTNITDGTSYRWIRLNNQQPTELGVTTNNSFTFDAATGALRIKVVIEGSACGSNLEAYTLVNGVSDCNNCPCDVQPGDQDVNLNVNSGNPSYNGFGCLPKVCKSNINFPIVVTPQLASSCSPVPGRFWWRRVLPTEVETFSNPGIANLTINESQVTTPGIYLFEYHHELSNNCHAPIFYGFEVVADGTGMCGSSQICSISSLDTFTEPQTKCLGNDFTATVSFTGTGLPGGSYTVIFELFQTNASGGNKQSLGSKSVVVTGNSGSTQFTVTPTAAGTMYLAGEVRIEGSGCPTTTDAPRAVTILSASSTECVNCQNVTLPVVGFTNWLNGRTECANEAFNAQFKVTGAIDPVWKIERKSGTGSYVDVTNQTDYVPGSGQLIVNLPQTITTPQTYTYKATILQWKNAQGTTFTCQAAGIRTIQVRDCSCNQAIPVLNLPSSACAGQSINLVSLTSGGYGPGSYEYGVTTCSNGINSTNRISNPSAYIMPSNSVTISVVSKDGSSNGCPDLCVQDAMTLKTVGCTTCGCVAGGQSFNKNVGPTIASITAASGQGLASLGTFHFPYSASQYSILETDLKNYLSDVCTNPVVDVEWETNNNNFGVFSVKIQGVPAAPLSKIPTTVQADLIAVSLTAGNCSCNTPTINGGSVDCQNDGFFYLPSTTGTTPLVLTCTSSVGTCAQLGNGVKVTGPTSGQVTLNITASNKCGLDTFSTQLNITNEGCESIEYTLGTPFCNSQKLYVPITVTAGQVQSKSCGLSPGVNGTTCEVVQNPPGYTGWFAVVTLGCSTLAGQVPTGGLTINVTLNGELKSTNIAQSSVFNCCGVCQGTAGITSGAGPSCNFTGVTGTAQNASLKFKPVVNSSAITDEGNVETNWSIQFNDSCSGNIAESLSTESMSSAYFYKISMAGWSDGDKIGSLKISSYYSGSVNDFTLNLSSVVLAGGNKTAFAAALQTALRSAVAALSVPSAGSPSHGSSFVAFATYNSGTDHLNIYFRNNHVSGTSGQLWMGIDIGDHAVTYGPTGVENNSHTVETVTTSLLAGDKPYKCASMGVNFGAANVGPIFSTTNFYQMSLNVTNWLAEVNANDITTVSPTSCPTSGLTVSVSGATCSSPTYLWQASSGGQITSGLGTSTITTNGTGTYTVTVLCGDGCGYTANFSY